MARHAHKALIAALALAACAPAGGEETLTLVSSWNRQINFSQHAQHYIDAVNERGRGVVQIERPAPPRSAPGRRDTRDRLVTETARASIPERCPSG